MATLQENEIMRIIREHGSIFWSLAFFSALINLMMLAPSIYMLQVYDRVLPSGNEMTLLMLTLIMPGICVVMGLLEYARNMTLICLGNRFDLRLNHRVYMAAAQANLQSGTADAGQRLHDLTTLRQFLTGNALFAFFDLPWFPVYLLLIFLFNSWLGLLALLGALLLIALAVIHEAVTRTPLASAGKLAGSANSQLNRDLSHAEVIRAMGMLPALHQRWLALHHRFLYQQSVASQRAAILSTLSKNLRLLLQSLVLGWGAWLALAGQITPGMMIAGSILMGRTLAPVDQIINAWKSWGNARLAWQRLNALLKAVPPPAKTFTLPVPKGFISADRIASGGLLPSVSFALKPGDVLGVVGPGASGKSTLARMLVGIVPLSAGRLQLDNADISQWSPENLGPHIGYLPQNIALFSGTVAENIARFNQPDAAQVIAAARLAGVHELILSLPQGYETPVGHSGTGLSGGQMQRIALARALYGDPTLIVLDEPDASLDNAGEQELSQTLRRLKALNKTVVLVTHRPAQLNLTTKLLLLCQGTPSVFGATRDIMQKLRQAETVPDVRNSR
ncbi:type I secretion system permease/ATPase [Erwinia sp. BNK-24-b]|uniref:type I secretion system permease/ATPase n=1 Tax=unclassified Erwinia TaxID=2622719 RepID=UPI0039BFFF6D